MTLCFVAVSTPSVTVRPSAVVLRSSLFKGNLEFCSGSIIYQNSRKRFVHELSRFLENIEFALVAPKLDQRPLGCFFLISDVKLKNLQNLLIMYNIEDEDFTKILRGR